MKGGEFSISETFTKILSTAYLAVVLLAIFFTINNYNLVFLENKIDRETLVVGNTILTSCIAEYSGNYPIKALLSENNISSQTRNANPNCLKFSKGIYIEIYNETSFMYGFGNPGVCTNRDQLIGRPASDPTRCIKKDTTGFTIFPAALNRTTKIIPVNLTIFVGVV